MYMRVLPVCMYVHRVCASAHKEEGTGFPGIGVVGHHVGAGNPA